MAGESLSTNMSMPIPGVGITIGPQWATDINSSLTIVDNHNHTPGYGIAVPSNGLNINADLPFNDNNAITLRSTRYQSQNSVLTLPADVQCVYVVSQDLYYNDGAGNNIRLTQNGSVAGTSGSIANLALPASVAYISASRTFVFQSNTNTPGNIDVASITLRNLLANSHGLTIAPPASMPSDTTITLPTIPSTTSLLTIDSSGNIATIPVGVVPSGTVQIYAGSSVPAGYLAVNGAAVSRTIYSNLFAAIGTTYGPGDGSTTFNVPSTITPIVLGTALTVPSYVQSYWKMNAASGGELNYGTGGSTYNLAQTGTVPSSTGWVGSITSRGPFTNGNYFSVPLGSSNATPYDIQTFAIGFWFRAPAYTFDQNMIGKYNESFTNQGWEIGIEGTSNPAPGVIYGNLGGTTFSTGGFTYNDGNWHLCYMAQIATSGAQNLRIYVDNVLVTSSTGSTYTPASSDLCVGTSDAPNPRSLVTGELQLVEFWNSMPATWTQFESLINARWNGGAGSDYVSTVPQQFIIKT